MSEPTAGDVALACMAQMADELAGGGVDAVCISPGSRSTPLALGFARHGGFDVRVILDERSAAFFALGRARATRKPVALVCTSGTATANYFPAIVEASMSGIPLIVLTADRPPELRGTGANQTIDQRELYGRYVQLFLDPGVPRAHSGAADEWRRLARRALTAARTGPVHIDLSFEEPLLPTDATPDIGRADSQPQDDPVSTPADMSGVADLLDTDRGVVVAGQIHGQAGSVADLARRLGWPLIAEPLSNLRLPGRALRAGQALLMDDRFSAEHVPDVVIQFGATPTTRATQHLVAAAKTLVVVAPRPADPAKRAHRTVVAAEGIVASALMQAVDQHGMSTWTKDWFEADATARTALDRFLDDGAEPFEPRIARDVADAIPDGTTLLVASRTPVRDLDLTMAPREGLRVLANRGASGIDGFVSTALGVASAGAPTVALAGDLSMLHDASGLVWGARRSEPVTFVVVNNGGGGIFDLLPSGALQENDALFVASHEVDLRALAGAAGIAYEHALDPASSIAEPAKRTTLVEVPIDRARAVERRALLRDAIARALSRAG
ncbi:MAG: 2-succinyl-5-enolpyruvyl-6-hydroxy-3-cyclohexene-1-carboxylic-acid synthase [Actinomycetota bacterium]